MYVTVETDFPERFLGLKEIFVRVRNHWEKRRLLSSRMVSGRPVLRFEGVTSPEAAARLTNRDLAVLKSQVVALPKDTYYVFDLLGCLVVEEGSGKVVGLLVDVERYPANDVYVIEDAAGRKLRCAAVKQFIKEVDIQGRTIRILTGGLFEEDAT